MFAERNGKKLFYVEDGTGPPMLLVHCWAGNHVMMLPLAEHFRGDHRVISVDVRGHGQSDRSPDSTYTLTALADDLIGLCDGLDLKGVALIGHSMGGNIVLEIAARRPDLARAVVILDASTVPPPGLLDGFRPVLDGIRTPAYLDVLRGFYGHIGGFERDAPRKAWFLDQIADNAQHVLVALLESVLAHDTDGLAARCKAPTLYVSSGPWYSDVARFRTLCPTLVTGQVVGCGHNLQLEAPEQVNPMVRRFLEYYGQPESADVRAAQC
jgi:pimeloyl-ACP methyl ester carboxylesterase